MLKNCRNWEMETHLPNKLWCSNCTNRFGASNVENSGGAERMIATCPLECTSYRPLSSCCHGDDLSCLRFATTTSPTFSCSHVMVRFWQNHRCLFTPTTRWKLPLVSNFKIRLTFRWKPGSCDTLAPFSAWFKNPKTSDRWKRAQVVLWVTRLRSHCRS